MKRLARLLLLMPLLGAAGGAAAPEPAMRSERYVPAAGWHDDWEADFYERWVGNQLRAMNEPSLSGSGSRRHYRQRFRMLVLPNDHPAYAVRVDEGRTGKAVGRFVILDGAGGYSPGRVADEADFVLNPTRKRRLAAALAASGIRTAPRVLPLQTRGNETLICGHATVFVFELIDAQGTHIVTRDCDLAGGLLDLMRQAEALRRIVDPVG